MTGRTLFTAAAAREGKTPNAAAWRTVSLDIEGCERVEFVTKATPECPMWPPEWPAEIRETFEVAIRRWLAEHDDAVVRAITSAVTGPRGSRALDARTCVVIVHFHRNPSASAVRDGSPENRLAASAQSPAGTSDRAAPDKPHPGAAGAAKACCGG